MSKICIIESDKIVKASHLMDENTDLVEWNSDLGSLTNGFSMFRKCSNLTTFTSDLGSLENGWEMFRDCLKLTTFECSDLSSLTNGYNMFFNCTNLTTFECSDLSPLTNGYGMFRDCSSLTTFNCSNLSSLTNGEYMFRNCSNLTDFTTDLSSLTNGYYMFYWCDNLTNFTANLSSLTNGEYMFRLCNLNSPSVQNIALTINKITDNARFDIGINKTITSDAQVKKDLGLIKHKGWDLYVNNDNETSNYTLPKYAGCTTVAEISAVDSDYKTNDIIDGVWGEHLPDLVANSTTGMFGTVLPQGRLTEFRADLSSLEEGTSLFYGCTKLTTFTTGKLEKLWITAYMFDQTGLTSFNYDLPAVTHSYYMFEKCTNLTSFKGTLKNVVRANHMFYMCHNFANFESDLSSLTNGYYMFKNCCLSTKSLKNIAETIKDVRELTDGTSTSSNVYKQIHIGTYSSTLNEEDIAALNAIYAKGWSVYVLADEYIPSSVEEAQLDNENIVASPYYAKPIPVLEEDAEYIDENGNFFIIAGGHHIFVDDPETYGIFANEADAAANMRLTKIEK